MPAKSLAFHEAAEAECLEAVDWYLDRSEGAAAGFVEAFTRAAKTLANAPDRWPIYIHGARRILLERFPYAIVYRVLRDEVQVIAVAHCSRRPAYWKGRRG